MQTIFVMVKCELGKAYEECVAAASKHWNELAPHLAMRSGNAQPGDHRPNQSSVKWSGSW